MPAPLASGLGSYFTIGLCPQGIGSSQIKQILISTALSGAAWWTSPPSTLAGSIIPREGS